MRALNSVVTENREYEHYKSIFEAVIIFNDANHNSFSPKWSGQS